jgi:outer membrane protein OmpA-like peptidoglycan-associated protein
MKKIIRFRLTFLSVLVLGLVLAAPVYAQDNTKTDSTMTASLQKVKTKGVIVKREADTFTMRDQAGMELTVKLTDKTEVKEKKGNPFRGSKSYSVTQLLRGLNVEVEGHGSAGTVEAKKIKFSDADFRVAQSVESRVNPVEGRLGETETRLSESEKNAQRLSGQIGELNELSNAARGGAKAAQESADAAMAGVNTTNERVTATNQRVAATNERISALDDFEVKNNLVVNFKVGSSVLSADAKSGLDGIAEQTKAEKGFVIEITGFASADGSQDANRRLSQRRADAVVRYLAENHNIPLRRIITPFGYGEKQPMADNSTRDGRKQNRRVEVKILVSRGMLDTSKASAPSSDGQ